MNDTERAIATYCGHFEEQLRNVAAVQPPLYRKILTVSIISALARGRYGEGRDREQFVALINEHSGWEDCDRISIPQLAMRVDEVRRKEPKQYTEAFLAAVDAAAEQWGLSRQVSYIHRLDRDPKYGTWRIAEFSPADREVLEGFTHAVRLYRYRCALVHEFRQAGHGAEFSSKNDSPYYHLSGDRETGGATWELVYPELFIAALPGAILANLRRYYLNNQIDPYASYRFGSPWR